MGILRGSVLVFLMVCVTGFGQGAYALDLVDCGFDDSDAVDGNFLHLSQSVGGAAEWLETDTLNNIWFGHEMYVDQGNARSPAKKAVLNSTDDYVEVDLSGTFNVVGQVTFWFRGANANDDMWVEFQVNGATQWSRGSTVWPTTYQQQTVDVNQAGDIKLRWYMPGVYPHTPPDLLESGIYLDDVVVTEGLYVSMSAATASPTNEATVDFVAEFSQVSIQNFDDASDVVITADPGVSYTGVAVDHIVGRYYRVRLTGVSGDGDLSAAVSTASDVQDSLGNPLVYSDSASVRIDNTPPNADAVAATTPNPTTGGTVSFSVHFDELVRYFDDASDVVLTVDPGVNTGGLEVLATVDPQTYTVNVTGVSGDGALTVAASTGSDIEDLATNPLASSDDDTVIIDNTAPMVSVTATTPSPTNSGTVVFSVQFDEDVVNFESADDVVVTTDPGVSYVVVSVSPVDARNYTVEVLGVTGNGDLTLEVNTGSDIVDLVGFALASSGSDTVTMDNIAPNATTVSAITPSPTNSDTVWFSVAFDEAVQYFNDASDVVVTADPGVNTGTLEIFTTDPQTYSVKFSGVSGNGDLTLAVSLTSDVADLATNPLASSDDATLNIDNLGPEAVVSPTTSSPTNSDTVSFSVVFNEAVQYFDDASDLVVTAEPGVNTGPLSVIPIDPENYTAEMTGVSGDGDLTLAVDLGSDVRDLAANPMASSGPGTLEIDNTPPTSEIVLLSTTPTGADSVDYQITFDDLVAPTFTTADVALTGDLAGIVALTLDADPVYEVTVTPNNPNIDGTIQIAVGTDVTDKAGNPHATASSPICEIFNWFGFISEPEDAQLYVGDEHSFPALADCASPTVHYQWKWDDLTKTVYDVGEDSPTYTISSAAETDVGLYWCGASYDGETHWSNTGTLAVEEHLVIVTAPRGGSKLIGEPHTFTVGTTGGYQPVRYQWKKDGVEIPDATDDSYYIAALSQVDSGYYSVVARDDNTDVREAGTTLGVGLPVPVAGLAGLIVLAGACALGGLAALRKRR